jgi:hypothetical protein
VTFTKFVCVVLLVTVLVLVVKPARAEALDPILISLIVSGAIVVVALVAILIIANMSEGRRRGAETEPAPATQLVVLRTWTLETSTLDPPALETAATRAESQ